MANDEKTAVAAGFPINRTTFAIALVSAVIIGSVALFCTSNHGPLSLSGAAREDGQLLPSQQAKNLAYDAQGMLFPMFEIDLQKHALDPQPATSVVFRNS